MPVTVTGGTSIRLPLEDALAGTNDWYSYKCDEASGNIIDYGIKGIDLTAAAGSPTYNQAMIDGVVGILFTGAQGKYEGGIITSSVLGYGVSTNPISECTVECLIMNKGTPWLTSGTYNDMGEIINFAGDDGRLCLRQVKDKGGTGEFGFKWGVWSNGFFSGGPANGLSTGSGRWDTDGGYHVSGSTTNVYHVAWVWKKGADGVGYSKIFIDNVDQADALDFAASASGNDWGDYGNFDLYGDGTGSFDEIAIGARGSVNVGGNCILSHIAIWDTALTDFSGAAAAVTGVPPWVISPQVLGVSHV